MLSVVMDAFLYLIRRIVMSPRWRHYAGAPRFGQDGDSEVYNRPLVRTLFRQAAGYPAVSSLALSCLVSPSEAVKG